MRTKREENTFLFFKKYEKESCKKAINYFESDLLKAQNRDDNGKKNHGDRKKIRIHFTHPVSLFGYIVYNY